MMKITARRQQQAHFPRDFLKLALVVRLDAGITDFEPIATSVGKVGKQGTQPGKCQTVLRRVRQYTHPADPVQHIQRFRHRRPGHLDVADLTGTQITLEGLLLGFAHPGFDQRRGEMRAPDLPAGRTRDHIRQKIRQIALLQLSRDALGTLSTHRLESIQVSLQRIRTPVEAQSDEMHHLTPPERRQLDAGQQPDSERLRRIPGFVQTADAVMISDRQHLNPLTGGAAHQIRRRQCAVGRSSVAVQVVFRQCHWQVRFISVGAPIILGVHSVDAKLMKLLLDFLPVIIFFIVYKATGNIVLATAILIPATLAQMLYTWIRTHSIEKMQLVTLVLVVLLGGATVLFQDKTFIQWKPTVVNWLFALAFLGSQFIGSKTIVQRLMESNLELPTFAWRKLNIAWVLFFVVMGALNLLVAYTLSEEAWVNFKLFGMLGLTLIFILLQGLYMSRHIQSKSQE